MVFRKIYLRGVRGCAAPSEMTTLCRVVPGGGFGTYGSLYCEGGVTVQCPMALRVEPVSIGSDVSQIRRLNRNLRVRGSR